MSDRRTQIRNAGQYFHFLSPFRQLDVYYCFDRQTSI